MIPECNAIVAPSGRRVSVLAFDAGGHGRAASQGPTPAGPEHAHRNTVFSTPGCEAPEAVAGLPSFLSRCVAENRPEALLLGMAAGASLAAGIALVGARPSASGG